MTPGEQHTVLAAACDPPISVFYLNTRWVWKRKDKHNGFSERSHLLSSLLRVKAQTTGGSVHNHSLKQPASWKILLFFTSKGLSYYSGPFATSFIFTSSVKNKLWTILTRDKGFFAKPQHNNATNICQSPFVSIAESNSNPCLHLGNGR